LKSGEALKPHPSPHPPSHYNLDISQNKSKLQFIIGEQAMRARPSRTSLIQD